MQGPLVVGVDASRWDLYGHGVFDACERDATVNHAVVLVGRYSMAFQAFAACHTRPPARKAMGKMSWEEIIS